jgi:hypothetical protein
MQSRDDVRSAETDDAITVLHSASRRDEKVVDSEIFSRRLDALEGYLARLRSLGEVPEA